MYTLYVCECVCKTVYVHVCVCKCVCVCTCVHVCAYVSVHACVCSMYVVHIGMHEHNIIQGFSVVQKTCSQCFLEPLQINLEGYNSQSLYVYAFHSFIHYDNLHSTPSRNLLRSAPSPATTKEKDPSDL